MDTLARFSRHFGIHLEAEPRQVLFDVIQAFSRLPYENITKIIKHAEYGSAEKARRYPGEVIAGHIAWGAGGTCFSLTMTLLDLLRGLGWKAEPILADRRYGQDTHCALLIWIEGVPHLLDPGYLILNPIPIGGEESCRIQTGFNELLLEPEGLDGRISLSTIGQSSKAYRLSYKTSPADEGAFFNAWDRSFDWDMMQYPLLTSSSASGQTYLRGSRLQISKGDSTERRKIAETDLAEQISSRFQIEPSVVVHAISILKSRG